MILIATTMVTFMGPFDGSVVNLALPTIGRSLGAQLSSLVWIPAVFLLVTAASMAPMGRIGDVRGRKNVLSVGIVIFILASALAGFSPSVLFLISSRIIQGVGAAIMSVSAPAIVTDTFRNDRGRALGINTSAVYSGQSFGPIIGGILVQYVGWRSIFYVNVPIGIVALLVVLLYVPKGSEREVKRGFDIPGSILFSLFLGALMLFLSKSELSLSELETLAFVFVSIVAIISFVLVESKLARDPVIDLKLFTHNKLFTAGNLTSIFNYTTNQGTLFVISLYLQFVRGFSPISAGLLIIAQPIVQAITSIVSGELSDRVDARILSSVGIAFRAAGLFGLSFLTTSSNPEAVWIPMAIIGFGHGMFSPPNTNSVMSSVESDKRGIAAGIMGTMRTASSSMGVVALSAIIASAMPAGAFAAVSGSSGSIAGSLAFSFVTGMHYAFIFAGIFAAIGILTSMVRGKEDRTVSSGQSTPESDEKVGSRSPD